MSSQNSAANPVVQKYAKALFDVTYDKGTSGEGAQQLTEISKAFSSDVLSFFGNPFNSLENKVSIVRSTFEGKAIPEVFNFLCLLAENNRMGLLSDIARDYSAQVQLAAGITKGKLFSAVEISQEFLKQVEAQASKTLGKKVELVFEKDPSLVAGYKVQVGGWTMDDSADAHLRILKDELLKKGL